MDPCGDEDDGLFVLIVEDKDDKKLQTKKRKLQTKKQKLQSKKKLQTKKRTQVKSKKKTSSDDVESSTDLEIVKNELINIKDESDATDIEYNPVSESNSEDDTLAEVKNNKSTENNEKRRMRLLPPKEQKSFVNKLRQEHPELMRDKEALIDTLSRIMADTKCPSPPDDFFVEHINTFKCRKCGKEKSHKNELARHWQERHGPRYLVCYACGADFRSVVNLYKHEKRCDSSDALIVLKARAHRQRITCVGRPYRNPINDTQEPPTSYIRMLCEAHPELANNKELLIKTISKKMAKEEPPDPPVDFFEMNDIMYKCKECGAQSVSQSDLTRHWQCVHGPRYLQCYACGRDFRDPRSLYKHEKRCTAPDANIAVEARVRGAGGRWGRGRARRFGRPTPESKPNDRLCDSTEKVKCTLCPAEFKSMKSLTAHELSHAGQRPYRCAECPAAYTSSSGLARHKRTHTNHTYLCDKCERTFRSKDAMKNHMKTHLPQRKFKCEYCDKKYAQKFAVQIHVNRDHLKLPPPHACQICPKRYPRMNLLKVHMLKEHGMNLITRNMFYRSLPHLSSSQLRCAKIVKKSDIVPSYQTNEKYSEETNNVETIKQEIKCTYVDESDVNVDSCTQEIPQIDNADVSEENFIEDNMDGCIVLEALTEKSNTKLSIHSNATKNILNKNHQKEVELEKKVKVEQVEEAEIIEDDDNTSKDLLEYVKKLQREVPSKIKPFVVIKDGQAIFMDGDRVDFYKQNVKTKTTK